MLGRRSASSMDCVGPACPTHICGWPRHRNPGNGAGVTGLPSRKFLKHAQYGLDRVEDIVLRHEAHFDVELIELPWATVGPRVLVSEAGRNLKITVEARHHQELLELLGA